MLRSPTLGALALIGLLAAGAASAGDRGYAVAQPRVSVGISLNWGGYGYGYAPPPVAWYPAPYPVYYYRPAPVYVYGPPPFRGERWGHHKHWHPGRGRGR